MLIPDLVRQDMLWGNQNSTPLCHILLRRVCTYTEAYRWYCGVFHKPIIGVPWLGDTQTTASLLNWKLLLKIGWYHVRQVLFSHLIIQPKCAMITICISHARYSSGLIHFHILHLALKIFDCSLNLLRWLHSYYFYTQIYACHLTNVKGKKSSSITGQRRQWSIPRHINLTRQNYPE